MNLHLEKFYTENFPQPVLVISSNNTTRQFSPILKLLCNRVCSSKALFKCNNLASYLLILLQKIMYNRSLHDSAPLNKTDSQGWNLKSNLPIWQLEQNLSEALRVWFTFTLSLGQYSINLFQSSEFASWHVMCRNFPPQPVLHPENFPPQSVLVGSSNNRNNHTRQFSPVLKLLRNRIYSSTALFKCNN